MRRLALATVFLFSCPVAFAQMHCRAMSDPGGISPCAKELAAAVSQDDFQKVYWPALMKKLTEEKNPGLPFFRQGLTQYYGLNYEEAMRNFKEAKKYPGMTAMASWGIALAAGPNINLNMTDACHCLAKKEIKRAACLAGVDATIDLCQGDIDEEEACKPAGSITPLESDLIEALKQRYDYKVPEEAKKHAEDYRDAMANISKQHPDDKNVSTLYAESMMDLNAWDLYNNVGLPKRDETKTIVDVLKRSTGDSPEAIGANHYYIHAVEGSNPFEGSIHPVDALPSANLLQTQVPESGHLVHMSSHIYLLLGEYQESPQGPKINGYQKSLKANIIGANNDVTQYNDACQGTYKMYTENDKCPQLYYGHYLSHNYFFGSVSATFMGQSKNAIALACDTQAHVQRFVAYEPGLQRYLSAPFMTLVVNRNWGAICDETKCKEETTPPEPKFKPDFEDCYSQGQEDSDCHILRSIWYWARGMARVAYSKDAKGDLNDMSDEIGKIAPCSMETRTIHNTFGNNCAKTVLDVGKWILKARITWAECMFFPEPELPLTYLNKAVAAEDELLYDEPPQWFTPAREALAGAYLQAAKAPRNEINRDLWFDIARGIFSQALLRHPASGRALYGKMRALQELGKESKDIKDKFCTAWQNADYTMTDADLWPEWPEWGNKPKTYEVTCPKTEKEVTEPSTCACQATTWPPPDDAKDVPADAVNYPLLNCPKKTTMPAGAPVTGTPPVP